MRQIAQKAAIDEAVKIRRRLAGNSVYVAKSQPNGRLAGDLEGHSQSQRVQNLALGMGGQSGGLVNERGHFPEICKKSLQAMAADMQGAVQTSSG